MTLRGCDYEVFIVSRFYMDFHLRVHVIHGIGDKINFVCLLAHGTSSPVHGDGVLVHGEPLLIAISILKYLLDVLQSIGRTIGQTWACHAKIFVLQMLHATVHELLL